jgi:hypothetical protein
MSALFDEIPAVTQRSEAAVTARLFCFVLEAALAYLPTAPPIN